MQTDIEFHVVDHSASPSTWQHSNYTHHFLNFIPMIISDKARNVDDSISFSSIDFFRNTRWLSLKLLQLFLVNYVFSHEVGSDYYNF